MLKFWKKTLWTAAITASALVTNVLSADAQKKAPAQKTPAKVDTIYMKKTNPFGPNSVKAKTDCGDLLIIFNDLGKKPVFTVAPKVKAPVKKAPVVKKTAPVKKATPVKKTVKKPVVKKKTETKPVYPIVRSAPVQNIAPVDTAKAITPVDTNKVATPVIVATPVDTTAAKTPDTTVIATPVTTPVITPAKTETPVIIKTPEKKTGKGTWSVVVPLATLYKGGDNYQTTTTRNVPFHLQKPAGYTGPWSYPETVQVTDTLNKSFNNATFGLGIEYRLTEKFHVAGGFISNAVKKPSFYVSGGAETNGNKFLGVGGEVTLRTGYGNFLKPAATGYVRLGERDARMNVKIGINSAVSTPAYKVPTSAQIQLRFKLFNTHKQQNNHR